MGASDLPEISQESRQILDQLNIVDLHVDGMIPHRLVGYDLNRRHGTSITGGRFFGHLDFPRAKEYGLSGAMWSITTNPLRRGQGRWAALLNNIRSLERQVEASAGAVIVARSHREYVAGVAAGCHVVLPAIQGGNALSHAPSGLESLPDNFITRVTLVHLTNSCYGVTSSPLSLARRGQGLTEAGRALVADLNAHRVFVDLAHINEKGFWDALEVHDSSQPLLVTHTGVDGVCPHWRNLTDDQLRAVADTGGVIGVIFHYGFLSRRGGPRNGLMVLEHMEHIIAVVGEDHVAMGSDYDGAIIPPIGLRKEPAYGRIIQWMLERGWTETRIEKVLGANFMRCFKELRPG
jgi:membrane dipeptidase